MGPADYGWAVVCNEDLTLQCFKCQGLMEPKDVAMLIRTLPDSSFETWCPRCVLWLVTRAADSVLSESEVATL